MKLHISKGNTKLGATPNVSLPPITTCRKDAPCFQKCYAKKFYKAYPTVKTAWDENLDLWYDYRGQFTGELHEFLYRAKPRAFRWHVGGDIPSEDYLEMMLEVAATHPSTQFLCFTKQYDVVNKYIENLVSSNIFKLEYIIPTNMHLIFSGWGKEEVPNPYNLPTSQVIFKGEEPRPEWKICGGNCTECRCQGIGCWELKYGETIAFYEH